MTRVRVEVPLRLATLAPSPLFAEESHTLVVNPQGCGVKLSRALDPASGPRAASLAASDQPVTTARPWSAGEGGFA